MTKTISVLMGVYNCADTLPQAVAAIREQTYEHWELILCDDGSADDTYEVACRLAVEDKRIRVSSHRRLCGTDGRRRRLSAPAV